MHVMPAVPALMESTPSTSFQPIQKSWKNQPFKTNYWYIYDTLINNIRNRRSFWKMLVVFPMSGPLHKIKYLKHLDFENYHYQWDRYFSCDSKDIGTRDNSRANILESGFDFIDHLETAKRASVLESFLFTLYSIRQSSIQ